MDDWLQTPPETIHETLTSPMYEDVSAGLSALFEGVAALDLASMSQISIVGADRVRWLNGMLTNNIQGLEEGRGNYNFILNAQGRIQGDAYVFRHGDRLLLHSGRSQTQKLLDHLEHFIIMDDVELKPSSEVTALGVAGPGAVDLLRKLGIADLDLAPLSLADVEIGSVKVTLIRAYSVLTPRYELWFEVQHTGALWQALLSAGATACSGDAAEALRIVEGIPAYGVDLQERNLPQETGQDRALNFSKGCYLGQEIVERIRSRGNLHRAFLQMELTGSLPSIPTDLRVDEKSVGQITSAISVEFAGRTRLMALGFLRSELLTGRIEYDGGTANPINKKLLGTELASFK